MACATLSSTYASRGIMIFAPRSMEQGGINKLYFTREGFDEPGVCAVTLQKTNEAAEVIAETVTEIDEGERKKVIELDVPKTSEYALKISTNCSCRTDDDYTMYDQDEVNVHSPDTKKNMTFIQTDKPFYKPGQQVNVRVMHVNSELRPLGKDTKGDFWVEDTAGNRVYQHKNASLEAGMYQSEFSLANEPMFGTWKIISDVKGNRETAYFNVEKYVLPTFEVKIKPPPYVLADAENFTIKICAKYTYGKNVTGTLKLNCSVESWSWSHEKFPVVEYEGEIDGCFSYVVNVSLVDINGQYYYRAIKVVAVVKENGTGVERNDSTTITRIQQPKNIEFVQAENMYFKPGMPFYAKVKVTNPDNTAAARENVECCATISRERVLEYWWATRKVKYCRNYTSDEDGIIKFTVPPQKTDTVSLFLEAKCTEYGNTSPSVGTPRIYQPQTSTSAQAYYSPSKSFIQIHKDDDIIPCETTKSVKVYFTAEVGASYVMHYQVISRGELMHEDSVEVSYDGENDIAKNLCKDKSSVYDIRTPLVPSAAQQEVPADEDVDCSSGPIGIAEINFDVPPQMSPSVRLLAYYNKEDGETVADSAKFEVEKCFQNKVEFEFTDEEKQPGDKTSVRLKASPYSLCGTKVVDKSISLLDNSDSLTRDKVFDELKKFDNQQYYQRNHCNDKFQKGGKKQMSSSIIFPPRPPRPWSSSKYADALTSIEDVGWVVMTDRKVLNRPCSRNQGPSYESGFGGGMALASVGVRGGAPSPAPPPRMRPMLTTPVAFEADRSSVMEVSKRGGGGSGGASTATKSVVEQREDFRETWLFDLTEVGETGEHISKATLPHTITEWIGSAVCINKEDGLGLSRTAKMRGFQAFFISYTLPYSVIRGEKCPIIISTSNYMDKCLPITSTTNLAMVSRNGTVTEETSESKDICVCGNKIDTYKLMYTPKDVGTVNITVLARTAEDAAVCGDQEISDAIARDKITKPLTVEPEGFPQESVISVLICLKDSDESTYNGTFDVKIPEDVVEDSQRAYCSVSGNIMGPTIDGIDKLIQLPTGCGEQNMINFAPNCFVLDYLNTTEQLNDEIKTKVLNNLRTGYQNELKYRHPDGSYSAFGVSDKVGSIWLTAFVVKSYCQADKYIDIDETHISSAIEWIVQKQEADGCFPEVGKLFHEGMKGGVASQGKDSTGPLTAYILAAIKECGHLNETSINAALACIGKDTELTPYKAALYAYAAAVAKSPEVHRYLEYLSQKSITQGDLVYWKNVNSSESLNVETSSYAMSAMLKTKSDDVARLEALSICRYLNSKRNSYGGFISTQDTVVALEAISEFGKLISKDPVNMKIIAKGVSMEYTFEISEHNKLLVIKKKVPVVPSSIEVTATGRGCSLFQVTTRYNTRTPTPQKFFSLSIEIRQKDDKCNKATMTFCESYIPDKQRSNMALLEIKMLSGCAADEESLNKLIQNSNSIIKKYDIKDNTVILYYDETSNDVVCNEFDVHRVFPVENLKPATAKLYDYYAPEKEVSVDYILSSSC